MFTDAWRQSGHHESIKNDRVRRLSLTWKKASWASFVTTFTTAVAFLANVFSKLMPIQTFGIFAAIMVPVNYLLVVFVFPAVLMVHERYFSWVFGWCWRTIRRKPKNKTGDDEVPDEQEV